MDMVTLGMLIIDEIHFPSPRQPELDVLGGAGSWAIVGARFFRPWPLSKRIGWTVHEGSDFPANIKDEIESWHTMCNWIKTPERLTTRGWNQYGHDEERAFKYMTEKLRIDETQLTPGLLESRCFHLICTPARCISLVKGILARRRDMIKNNPMAAAVPLFVWEPVPDSMGPGALDSLEEALDYVDVVSPNHQELAALFRGVDGHGDDGLDMQARCSMLLRKNSTEDRKCAVVVRCGEKGCYVATSATALRMPSYHTDQSYVIDPTGAGNAFLGGFCIGLLAEPPPGRTDIENGAAYGSVAASFAVEQVGLPKMSRVDDGYIQLDTPNLVSPKSALVARVSEVWNGESAKDRLRKYWSMVDASTGAGTGP